MVFKNSYGHRFTLEEVLEQIHRKVSPEVQHPHRLIVGTDSQEHNLKTVYITVIVLHKVGRGGNIFYHKHVERTVRHTDLSVRLLRETEKTVKILKKIENSIVIDMIGRKRLSAHVDAGENGESKKVLDACVGWIRSLGFDCSSKPEAYVASHVADKYTKKA